MEQLIPAAEKALEAFAFAQRHSVYQNWLGAGFCIVLIAALIALMYFALTRG